MYNTGSDQAGGRKSGYECGSLVSPGKQAGKWVFQILQMSHDGKNCSNPSWMTPSPPLPVQPRCQSNASPKLPTSPDQPGHLVHHQWVQVQPLYLNSACLSFLPSSTRCLLFPVFLQVFSLKMETHETFLVQCGVTFNLLRVVDLGSIRRTISQGIFKKPQVTSGLVRHKCSFVILTKVNTSTSN